MLRSLAALAFALIATAPAAAMVGGAAPASDGVGRAAVMVLDSRGGLCTGTALARDLVLTAAHCGAGGAVEYKLLEFDAARKPVLKDFSAIARHPGFSLQTMLAHRATADVALLKLSAPSTLAPAALAPAGGTVAVGDRMVIAGFGLTRSGDGRTGGVLRSATLVATGQPGTLQIRLVDPATMNARAGLGACTGDSGAGVLRDINGRMMVIGVVSWSTGPNNSAGCGGLTGVTPLTRYRPWIVEQAGKMGSPVGP
jgi:hypothetical protein